MELPPQTLDRIRKGEAAHWDDVAARFLLAHVLACSLEGSLERNQPCQSGMRICGAAAQRVGGNRRADGCFAPVLPNSLLANVEERVALFARHRGWPAQSSAALHLSGGRMPVRQKCAAQKLHLHALSCRSCDKRRSVIAKPQLENVGLLLSCPCNFLTVVTAFFVTVVFVCCLAWFQRTLLLHWGKASMLSQPRAFLAFV